MIVNKSIEELIKRIYTEVFKKVYSTSAVKNLSSGDRIKVLENVSILESSKDYDNFAKKYSKELAKKGIRRQRGLWRKYYEAAKRLHDVALPKTWQEFEMKVLSNAVKENFKMIKSIPRESLKIMEHKYTSALIEEVAKGSLSRGSFKKELDKHGARNAKLIARTETAKLQTAITKSRATSVGSVAYIWLASNDKRTRQSHKAMNGVVVFWKDELHKPLLDGMRGDAGEFPNCRCDAQPIVDVDDLTNSRYDVYDYRFDKVRSIIKKDLIEILQKGGF